MWHMVSSDVNVLIEKSKSASLGTASGEDWKLWSQGYASGLEI